MISNTFRRYLWPLAAVLILFLVYLYLRPLPPPSAVSRLPAPPKTQAVSLPWPSGGQSALGAAGYGVLASHNAAAPVPIGSTAKVITALAVLKQKPVAAGSQGPAITLDESDVASFNSYYSQDGSVTQVSAGEQISELQALESLLLPSSNNMADSLAKWAFGSIAAYLAYANQMVKNMGLAHTAVGDTNGFSDTTTSTADDLVKIGLSAMSNPVIAGIVNESSALVPVAGSIKNTNYLLGNSGVVGIKTGHTDAAGGCYLFAAGRRISGHNITLVGAVLGQSSLAGAINSVPSLLNTADTGFRQVTVVHKDQKLGNYTARWGPAVEIKSAKDLQLFVWKGADIKLVSEPETAKASGAGTRVGKITAVSTGQSAGSPLILSDNLPGPSPLWRLIR